MVHYCRVIKAAELGGKLSCLVTDYAGLPGVIFNFMLRFEDQVGRVIREELEPVFVDQQGKVQPELGRALFLAPSVPEVAPNPGLLGPIQAKITELQQAAGNHIRAQYGCYYQRVEQRRNADIAVLLEDLKRFDQGAMETLQSRLNQLGRGAEHQLTLLNMDDFLTKSQRTRLENQVKIHQHRMQERQTEIENMRLGAFPAPELLNIVIVTPT
jgi:hypothetical protein